MGWSMSVRVKLKADGSDDLQGNGKTFTTPVNCSFFLRAVSLTFAILVRCRHPKI
jgi:hypothetical protein